MEKEAKRRTKEKEEVSDSHPSKEKTPPPLGTQPPEPGRHIFKKPEKGKSLPKAEKDTTKGKAAPQAKDIGKEEEGEEEEKGDGNKAVPGKEKGNPKKKLKKANKSLLSFAEEDGP